MNIAIVDVAAESGGALSILKDFADSITEHRHINQHWYIMTSVVSVPENAYVTNLRFPHIKHSWLHRLRWEYLTLPRLLHDKEIDLVISLQNNAFPSIKIPQIVFFHNVIISQRSYHFSFFKRDERQFAIYRYLLAPYIRYTWRYADKIYVQSETVKRQVARYFKESNIEVNYPKVLVENIDKPKSPIKGYIYPTNPYNYKNIEQVLEIAKILGSNGIEAEFLITITGDENEYSKKIKKFADTLNNVKLVGYLPRREIFRHYLNYGLIFTSKLESYGLPIREAIEVGTVVVCLDTDYAREIEENLKYNRMYIANDAALYDAVINGLHDGQESNFNSKQHIDTNQLLCKILDEIDVLIEKH